MAAIPRRAAAIAALFSLIIYFLWGSMVPVAVWSFYIPITIDPDTEATLSYPSLESAGILTAYRAAVAPVLDTNEQGTGRRWNVACVSSPTAGLSFSLTALFDPSISRKADILVPRIAEVLETTRGELFASIGIKLAQEAERIENDRPFSSAEPDSPAGESQPERLDALSANLDFARENLHQQLLAIEGEIARLKSATGLKHSPKKAAKPAKTRIPARSRSRVSNKRKAPPVLDTATSSRRLRLDAARIRQEIEQIDQAKRELATQKHDFEVSQTGLQQKKAELERIVDQNKALTRLFESNYGKPDLSRHTRAFPSLILNAWFAAQPVGLLIGPLLVWLVLRRRKDHAENSVLCDENPVLGTIPSLPPETVEDMLRPLCFAATAPREALAITKIAQDLFRRAGENECRTIAFIGSHDGCGTSVSTALIAAALLNDMKRPTLIDLHWRRPVQHRLWWIPWAAGTVNWLSSKAIPTEIIAGNPDENARVIVIPAGPLPPFPEEALKAAPWPLWLPSFPTRPAELLFADLGNFEDTPELMSHLVSSFDGFVLASKQEASDQAEKAMTALTNSGKTFLGFLYSDGASDTR